MKTKTPNPAPGSVLEASGAADAVREAERDKQLMLDLVVAEPTSLVARAAAVQKMNDERTLVELISKLMRADHEAKSQAIRNMG
jgi:hypothetical protein